MFSPNDGQPEGLAALVFIPIVILELGAAVLALAWIVIILRSRWRWPFFVYLAIFGALTVLFAADVVFVLNRGRLDTGGLIVTVVAGLGAVLFLAHLAAFVLHGVWGTRPSPD